MTFKGGFHPEGNKHLTDSKPTIEISAPKEVVIPLSQHIGAVCEPVVKIGDKVCVGQKIADSKAFVSVPIHSSVSGTVKIIEKRPHSTLGECMAIVIDNDEENTVCETIKPIDYEKLSKKEIINHIREAGIVGMGGAAFPTFIKLSIPEGKTVDTIIVNGAECEPYLTSDHRLMLEQPKRVIDGLKIMMKAIDVKKSIIVVEDNKKDAYLKLKEVACDDESIDVIMVQTKYPQGSEKQIIEAVLRRQVKSGTLPLDCGVVVQNSASVAQIATYFATGMPLISRIVTVSGNGVKNPCNLLAKIGTPFSYIAQYVGIKDDVEKIIAGGPMMGFAQYTLEVPVVKGTSGILFLNEDENKIYQEGDCIRCGRCVKHCPMRLMPFMITEYSKINDFDNAIKYGLKDCLECGVCSYICPQRRYLVQTIRTAKSKLPK